MTCPSGHAASRLHKVRRGTVNSGLAPALALRLAGGIAFGLAISGPGAAHAQPALTPASPTPAASEITAATASAPADGGGEAEGDATILVVATSPLPGTDIAADKLAGEVSSLAVAQLSPDRRGDIIANLAASRLAGISFNDEEASRFQPDLVFRGFAASPISGVSEGLVVYADGVRLNEAFGDAVNWDLVPSFAVRRFTVQSNNPVFGLNALGGAVTLEMKDGLADAGASAEVEGGSFGGVGGHVEIGRRLGAADSGLGIYLAGGISHDGGWRYHSPATLRQAYGDLGWAPGAFSLHLAASLAINSIDAVGPTPVQLLSADPRAVFTWPQAQRDAAGLVQLRSRYQAGPTLALSAQAYLRRFTQSLVDGNTTGVIPCVNNAGQLCLEGAGQYPADALYDSAGGIVAASALPAGAAPGEIDATHTASTSGGGTLQAALTAPIARHANSLTLGTSLDAGTTRYTAQAQLGALTRDLDVLGSGILIDQALSPTAAPPILAPVSVRAGNRYTGLYAIDVLDVTHRLSASLSLRWNDARVTLAGLSGAQVKAAHAYARLNPGGGLSWRVSDGLDIYAGYSEANRTPTAGELSCADPVQPCPLGAFLVSDPPLRQIVAHNFEAGLRGHGAHSPFGGWLTWSLALYRTRLTDDILLLASPINGFGYFANAGTTRRQGLDAQVAWTGTVWSGQALSLTAGYAFLDATFRGAETLGSNSPSADASGLIAVRPGDRLPLLPRHRLTVSAQAQVTRKVSLGAELRWQSAIFLRGDESNQQPPLAGYWTANLHVGWRPAPALEVFADVENLFDRRYATFGSFTSLDGLPPRFTANGQPLTDPRTLSPGEPRSLTLGARLRFN